MISSSIRATRQRSYILLKWAQLHRDQSTTSSNRRFLGDSPLEVRLKIWGLLFSNHIFFIGRTCFQVSTTTLWRGENPSWLLGQESVSYPNYRPPAAPLLT